MTIKYFNSLLPENDDYENHMFDNETWWHKKGLMQTATGYGNKLTTRHMIRYQNQNYRVYAICHGNCASHYVTIKGQRYYL